MKRASIAAPGDTVRRSHIVFGNVKPGDSDTLTLHEAIKRHIRHTVESFGGSRSKAAKALKCDPKTLRKYLSEDYGNNTEN
jgi:DNA-binding NtrC family response regulator